MRKRAFTLIELLVVTAIIGTLATIAVLNFNNAQKKSRDAKRVADLTSIKAALAMYYADYQAYPNASGNTSEPAFRTDFGNAIKPYLFPLPGDPRPSANNYYGFFLAKSPVYDSSGNLIDGGTTGWWTGNCESYYVLFDPVDNGESTVTNRECGVDNPATPHLIFVVGK